MLSPAPAVARHQMASPAVISWKPLTCLLACANMGEDMRRPTCSTRQASCLHLVHSHHVSKRLWEQTLASGSLRAANLPEKLKV